MQEPSCQLEFGVTSLADIRFLLKSWRRFLLKEKRQDSVESLVTVGYEDRIPEEPVLVIFQAAAGLLWRFLQALKGAGLTFNCQDLVPGMLLICHVTPETDLKLIDFRGGRGRKEEGD